MDHSKAVDSDQHQSRKLPLWMTLDLDVHCEICGRPRNKGDHRKCSRARQLANLKDEAKRPALH